MGSYLTADAVKAMLPAPRTNTQQPVTPGPVVVTPAAPLPTTAATSATQLPVNINVSVERDENGQPRYNGGRYNHSQHPPPFYGSGYGVQYPAGLPVLPGVPGGVPGVIGAYPGLASDASIKIGAINSSYAQGNTNVGGQQGLGAAFPMVTEGPAAGGAGGETSMPIMTDLPMPMMQFETMAPLADSSGPDWKTMAIVACVLVAFSIGAYFLYRYMQSKNSNGGNGNRGNSRGNTGNTGNTGNRGNANAGQRAPPAILAPPDEFGGDDFGNDDFR